VATPIGHTLVGLTLARRLGVRSPGGLAAAAIGASLPDVDIIPGILLHRDPWRFHRKLTHSPGFTMTAGMLAGFSGVVSAGSVEGERDLVADAMTGAAIMLSHVVLDRTPIPPYFYSKRTTPMLKRIRNGILDCLIDTLVYGYIAWRLWPREGDAGPRR
jgi:membrane-bound metal-dependent hydrolase YbcI (DUF457 family)